MVNLFGKKSSFSQLPWTTEILRLFISLDIHVFFFLTEAFQNNLNNTSTSNVREVMKKFDEGDQSLEIDFRCVSRYVQFYDRNEEAGREFEHETLKT